MSLPRLAFLALLVSASCAQCGPRDLPDEDSGTADPNLINCTSVADCPDENNYDCAGVCLQRCAADATCPDGQFCDGEGHCKTGCRDSSTCQEGTFCDDGDCVAGEGCASKCDCAPGQVCAEGSCTDPPATCENADDCPRGPSATSGSEDRCEDYQCNGFTHACFDDDPDPCTTADDCIGRPGCEEGCACTDNDQCVPDVDCTVDDELTTCGGGFYCDGDGVCQVLPACTAGNEGSCTSAGLVCNAGRGQCERARDCTGPTDCTIAPATYCDPDTDRCAVPSCSNGGTTCSPGQTCSSNGTCLGSGSGTACDAHTDCAAAEYCDFTANGGSCLDGCRNNAACGSGQICNGAHDCVTDGSGGGGQYGATCMADGDCQSGLICGAFTQTCAEPCGSPGTACAGDANCCPLSGQPFCNGLGFCWPDQSI